MKGTLDGSDTQSTYAFCKSVVGFDAAAFFERNASRLREEVIRTLETLLSAE
jgi:hypothetical protein